MARARSHPAAATSSASAVRPTRSSRIARFVSPSAIPSTPPRSSAIARPSRKRSMPSSTRPRSARSVPMIPSAMAWFDGEPIVRAMSRASSAIGIDSAKRPPNMRIPARWARIRARASDGGSLGMSRLASSTAAAAAARSPASQRYQRCRSSSPAARPGSLAGSTCAMARRPSSIAAGYSPVRTAVSAARTRISTGSTWTSSLVVATRSQSSIDRRYRRWASR